MIDIVTITKHNFIPLSHIVDTQNTLKQQQLLLREINLKTIINHHNTSLNQIPRTEIMLHQLQPGHLPFAIAPQHQHTYNTAQKIIPSLALKMP